MLLSFLGGLETMRLGEWILKIQISETPISHNRPTYPKAKQHLAPHPKPIQSLKMSYASYTSYRPIAKREAINSPPSIPSQKYTIALLQHLFDQSFSVKSRLEVSTSFFGFVVLYFTSKAISIPARCGFHPSRPRHPM